MIARLIEKLPHAAGNMPLTVIVFGSLRSRCVEADAAVVALALAAPEAHLIVDDQIGGRGIEDDLRPRALRIGGDREARGLEVDHQCIRQHVVRTKGLTVERGAIVRIGAK